MDESRIRVGTKIKIISDPFTPYCKIGDVGTIVGGTCYHIGDEVKDKDERYWADFKHPEHPKICIGTRCYPSCFKILKY